MERDVEIREELKFIIPEISWTDTKCPFVVPLTYFKELLPKIAARIKTESAALDTDSFNTEILQKQLEVPFKIPDGYFHELSDSVFSNTTKADVLIQPAKPNGRKILYIILSAAATILILIGLTHSNMFFRVNPSNNQAFAALSNKDIVDYLNYHMSLLDKEELINNSEVGSTLSNVPGGISTTSLENYLDSAEQTY